MRCLTDAVYELPEFKRLQELYSQYNRKYLKDALALWRDTYGHDDTTFPVEGSLKGSFTRFLNRKAGNIYQYENTSDKTKRALIDRYNELSDIYPPITLQRRVRHIANKFFSGTINDYLKQPGNERKSRKTAIEELGGYRGIMAKILRTFKEKHSTYEYWYNGLRNNPARANWTDEQVAEEANRRADEYKIMVAHFDALSDLVSREVAANEDLVINYDQSSKSIVAEEAALDDDKMQNNTEDGEGVKGDRFVDFRKLTLSETLSDKSKNILSECVLCDASGIVILDDIGQKQYMNSKEVSYKLLEIFTRLDPTVDFVTQLDTMKQDYPFLWGLVARLKKDPDLRTYIYCDFKRAAYKYTHIRTDEYGTKYEYHYENTSDHNNALMRRAGNIMRTGIPLNKYSIFGVNGLYTSSERAANSGGENIWDTLERISNLSKMIDMRKGGKPNKSLAAQKYMNKYSLNENQAEGMRELLSDIEASGELDVLVDAFRAVGIDITKEELKTAAMLPISETTSKMYGGASAVNGSNRLNGALRYLGAIYGTARYEADKGRTNIDRFFALNDVSEAFQKLSMMIAPALAGNVEPSVLSNGNRLQTYNKPNLLHDIFDVFKKGGLKDIWNGQKSAAEIHNRRVAVLRGELPSIPVIDKFGNYMKKMFTDNEGFTVNGEPIGWVKHMFDPDMKFEAVEATTFNGVEYENMTPGQKVASAIIRMRQGNQVEVPIMADYASAYNFIQFDVRAMPRVGESRVARIDDEKNKLYSYCDGDVIIDEDSEMVSAVVDEVLAEIEVIKAAKERLAAAKEGKWSKIDGYDDRAAQFQIFKEFNDLGVYEEYMSKDPDNMPGEAKDYLRKEVAKQLKKLVTDDLKYFLDSGVYDNPILQHTIHFVKSKDKNGRFYALELSMRDMVEFCLQNMYGRHQISKILNGGMAQFKSINDYEKRSMMNHAPRSAMYKEATWNGQRVGKDAQRVVYIGDSIDMSSYVEEVKTSLHRLVDEGRITERQYNELLSAYDGITETDGQGFRTFDSWREVQIMSGRWSNELEDAYQAIKSGNWDQSHVDALTRAIEYAKNFKPVYTGYEFVDGYNGGKKIRLSVTHKYAETVLLPELLLSSTTRGMSTPYRGLSMAAERLGNVDMFICKSGVKVNPHAVVDVFGKDKDGNRINPDSKSIADAIVNSVAGNPHAIHTLDYDYYGEAASMPAHVMDSSIAWAAQAETMAFSDAEDSDVVTVGGKTMTAKEAQRLHEKIKFSEALASWRQLQEILKDPNRLEKILQEELASKTYNSSELKFALQQIKNGGFAVPLFSSGVEHDVQELITSVIRKRLLRHKTKGANIFQTSSFGLDISKVAFQEEGVGDNKLKIEWENKGKKNQRIKYIECYLPITDSWLLKFADKNGAIPPARLQSLIDDGKIPESILYAVGYRTPSDGVHSLFPLKIKGFTSNIEGANILLPKEAMTLAGLDFDGDKLRVHLKSFKYEWDEDLIRRDYEQRASTDENLIKVALGQKQMKDINVEVSYEEFAEAMKRKSRRDLRYFKIVADEYDYSKSPEENSSSQRDNGRIDIIFSMLTSPSGTAKMLIPGGAEESVRMTKAIYIMRRAGESSVKDILRDAGLHEIDELVKPEKLYNRLRGMSKKQLESLIDLIDGADTPYSEKHAAQAHERIVSGKQLVAVYATLNAAVQTFQKADIHYSPYKYKSGKKKGEALNIKILGHDIDRLFLDKNGKPRNMNGTLLSRTISRLLNCAVDNAKEPILGLVNQTKELAPLTTFLIAAGVDEEQLHLIMSQPVLVEMGRRLKMGGYAGIREVAEEMILELTKDRKALEPKNRFDGVDGFNKLSESDYLKGLVLNYSDLDETSSKQIDLLYGILHLSPAISDLRALVDLTKPESHGGELGSSIAENTITFDKIRDLATKDEAGITFKGISLMPKYIDASAKDEDLFNSLGDLPLASLLNSLFYANTNEFFAPYFPQATSSWQEAALNIVGGFNYSGKYAASMNTVMREMMLWKLFQSGGFNGGSQEEFEKMQKYYVMDFPDIFAAKLSEIRKSKEKDADLFALKDNMFLKKLSVEKPKYKWQRPRIQFRSGGPSLSGFGDSIRRDWAALLRSNDPEIRKIGTDLYLYNVFTNGLGFGMYEFSHLAPFSVLMETPGFLDSLKALTVPETGAFAEPNTAEFENFVDQFYQNHWDDAKIVTHLSPKHIPVQFRGKFGLSADSDTGSAISVENFTGMKYFVLVTKENGKTRKVLYRRVDDGSSRDWVEAPRLGFKNQRGQVFVQYNPFVDAMDMNPLQAGESSQYGTADDTGRLVRGDSHRSSESAATTAGGTPVLGSTSMAEEAEKNADLNDKMLASAGETADTNEIIAANEKSEERELGLGENPSGVGGLSPESIANLKSLGGNISLPSMFMIAERRTNENGESVVSSNAYPVNANTARLARKQKAFVELNRRLREILASKGVAVGVITEIEERMGLQGIADFDTATVTAQGLVELIRVAEGVGGLEALPEEFAHLALEMLGHDHPLVKRLLAAIDSSEEAMREAFGDMYDRYKEEYGKEFDGSAEGIQGLKDKLVLEAAGKLVAKKLLYQQEASTGFIRRIVNRVVDAIKNLLRKFNRREIEDAMFEANDIASKLARDILAGRILDQMDLGNIRTSGKLLAVKEDLSEKNDILNRLLKNATKRLDVFQKRLRFTKDSTKDDTIKTAKDQISHLEDSIKNLTAEKGVYQYLSDSLDFLGEIETIFDKVQAGGYPMNVVCRYLRIFKDAIYSVSTGLEAIDKAIVDGEFQNNDEISQMLKKVTGQVNAYSMKYQKFAMMGFEEMLVNVYGPHGKTWTVGKDKGKTLTIHEMARRAEHDVTLMSRLFNSLADANDLVLKAFDDTTRNVKKNVRKRTAAQRARIEEALSALVRETGSRDQTFMFKYKRGEDGKMHKTGEYITPAEAEKLSPAKKHFYDVVMEVKHEIDQYLPESEIGPLKIIMITKSRMERVMAEDSIKGGILELWEGVQNSILDTSDDIDYENENVKVDFAGNRIDMLPIHYTRKSPKLTFDDMSDDVASTIVAYAGMGNEYNELSAVVDWLEVSKDMASQRRVVQKTGRKTQVETIADDETDYIYREPYTVEQVKTHMQTMLNDYFYMHLYGGLQRDEGTIGNTRIDKRKAANLLNHVASLSQMAVNLSQRISNITTGISMVVIESAGKGAFKAKDVGWATKEYLKYTPDRLAGVGSDMGDNKLSLWMEYHDVTNDNGREDKNRRYAKSRFRRMANENILYAGMLAGEDYLAGVTSLAIARNFKVLNPAGTEETLWDAYEVAYIDPANKAGAYLKLKDGYTKLDGSAITAEDEKRFSKLVAGTNFELQGIYNLDDKSAVQQYALGALIIMYRKWIAPALKRRYGAVDYSILKDMDVEGYYRTTGRYFVDVIHRMRTDGMDIKTAIETAWSQMNDYEKGNCKKAATEIGIILGCLVSIAALSKWQPGDDDEEVPKIVNWLDHQFLYQLMRLRNEIGSQAPTPMLVNEATKLLKSPMAAVRPLAAGLDALQLLYPPNYFQTVRSGRYKGRTKAHKYFFDLPIVSMTRNITNFRDPSSLVKFYNSKSY